MRHFRFENHVAALLSGAMVVVVAAALVAYAWPFWQYLNFHPLNGAFQTFNPTRRLLAGELPGDGFEPYLGVGVALFHAAITWALDGDFAANQFMSRLIPPVIVLAYVTVVMRLARFRPDVAVLLFWFTFVLILATLLRIGLVPYGLTLPDVFHEVIEPGTSALTSRLVLPLLTVAAIAAFLRLPEGMAASAPARAVFFGALTGLQPFWSNDYGIASFACLAAVYWLALARAERLTPALAMWSAAVAIAFGGALAFSGGADWLRYNFRSVAADQFWFVGFAGENPAPAYRVTDVPVPGWVWLYGGACAWLLWRAIRTPSDTSRALLAYVAATPFVAGLIATIGGHSTDRYFLPLRILLPFALGAIAVDLVAAQPRAGRPDTAVLRDKAGQRRSEPRKFAPVALLIVASAILWGPQFFDAFHSHFFNSRGDYFVEPLLGGDVQEFYSGLIGIGHEIAAETRHLPPKERVTSTYASALDVVAGSRNAPGQDYVIHALGDRARADFLAAFHAAQPRYATAISDRFTTWGEWQWYANWWFFRELLITYRPKYETSTHIVFERTESKLEPKAVGCDVTAESSHSAVITTQPLEGQAAAPVAVEVELTYSVRRSAAEPAGPFAAFRYFVDIEQLGSPEIPPRNFGAPPAAVDWPILVKDFAGKGASARVTVTPPRAWDLVVSGCKARVFGAANDLQRGRHFVTTPANVTDANWDRGVAIAAGFGNRNKKDGLIVRDRHDIARLSPGNEVLLASGPRRVAAVDGDHLWLEGPPPDSAVDGFPATIKLPRIVVAPDAAIVAGSSVRPAIDDRTRDPGAARRPTR